MERYRAHTQDAPTRGRTVGLRRRPFTAGGFGVLSVRALAAQSCGCPSALCRVLARVRVERLQQIPRLAKTNTSINHAVHATAPNNSVLSHPLPVLSERRRNAGPEVGAALGRQGVGRAHDLTALSSGTYSRISPTVQSKYRHSSAKSSSGTRFIVLFMRRCTVETDAPDSAAIVRMPVARLFSMRRWAANMLNLLFTFILQLYDHLSSYASISLSDIFVNTLDIRTT